VVEGGEALEHGGGVTSPTRQPSATPIAVGSRYLYETKAPETPEQQL